MDHHPHAIGRTYPNSYRNADAISTPVGLQPSATVPQQPTSRLFQIALQATVANADAARAESEQYSTRPQKKKPSHGTQHRSVHLTPQQWQLLTDYHEHDLFIRTRSWGFCLAIFGIGVAVFGMGSPAWKWIGDVKKPYEMGLWEMCFPNASCLSLLYYLKEDWKMHTSIICFLGCGCLFGFLGLGLAVTGACRSALILRMYYYHSAGECFLVSGIATAGSLVLYPISANNCIRNLVEHGLIKWPQAETLDTIPQRFAYNYYLTGCASCFFIASFVCMNLDLLIQSLVRPKPCLSATFYYLSQCHLRYRRRRSAEDFQATPANSPHSVNISTHTIRSNSATLSSNYNDNNGKKVQNMVSREQSQENYTNKLNVDVVERKPFLPSNVDRVNGRPSIPEVYVDETDDDDWI